MLHGPREKLIPLWEERWSGFYLRSRLQVFFRKGVLKISAKFVGKLLYQSLYFIKIAVQETLVQVFSCEFWEIFKTNFFLRTPLVAASFICFKEPFTKSQRIKGCKAWHPFFLHLQLSDNISAEWVHKYTLTDSVVLIMPSPCFSNFWR